MNMGKQIKIEDFDGETALVTIRGESRRMPASVVDYGVRVGAIHVNGFVGRYQTGTKDWPASATLVKPNTPDAWVDMEFGFESRSGKHSKRPTISFA